MSIEGNMSVMEAMIEGIYKSKEFQEKYQSAAASVCEYIRGLDEAYREDTGYPFIRYMESRIKGYQSMVKKLERKELDVNVENFTNHIHDIAGVRIICFHIRQIYEIARLLSKDDTYQVVKVKDYVRKPKKNGYESYHMVLLVNVETPSGIEPLEVELQIRTILMDAWASLDERLRYKKKQKSSQQLEEQIEKYAKCSRKMDKIVQEILSPRQKTHNS